MFLAIGSLSILPKTTVWLSVWNLQATYGKLFLTVFRIIASVILGWYLYRLTQKKETPFGLVICFSLIFAGAVGNIIDSTFYGLIFNDSIFQVASIFPKGGGYASFLHGRVVDMFYSTILKVISLNGFLFGVVKN